MSTTQQMSVTGFVDVCNILKYVKLNGLLAYRIKTIAFHVYCINLCSFRLIFHSDRDI